MSNNKMKPLDFLNDINEAINGFQNIVNALDGKFAQVDKTIYDLDSQGIPPTIPVKETIVEESDQKQIRPESGRTFEEQSQESYCLECVERHTMIAKTEMRHAIDRYRTAGKMVSGVTEKVRVALEEVNGIVTDVTDTTNASPEVKDGLKDILDEVRWISKEYGISGKGLTRGFGSIEDLEDLRKRIVAMQMKAYELVEKCPTCKINR